MQNTKTEKELLQRLWDIYRDANTRVGIDLWLDKGSREEPKTYEDFLVFIDSCLNPHA
jgi:hypothetical protein